MASKDTIKVVHRNSVDGRFVTEKYTDKHPRTTETQHVRVPSLSKKGK